MAFMAGVMVLLMPAKALAFSCTPVNKPIGSGVAGTATFDVLTETFTFTGGEVPAGKMKGNFITVSLVAGTTLLDQVDIFGHKDLPDVSTIQAPVTAGATVLESTTPLPAVRDRRTRNPLAREKGSGGFFGSGSFSSGWGPAPGMPA